MKNRLKVLIPFIVFCLMFIIIFFLSIEREEKIIEILELEQEIINIEKLSEIKQKKLNEIINDKNSLIDKLNSNNHKAGGYIIGDREINLEELLKLFNNTLDENQKLRNQVKKDEIIKNHIENSYGIRVDEDSIGYISLNLKKNSSILDFETKLNEKINELNQELEEKKFVLDNLQKRYEFKYEVKTENSKIYSKIFTTKLDSALMLYPYYKHKIKKNKKGELIIK